MIRFSTRSLISAAALCSSASVALAEEYSTISNAAIERQFLFGGIYDDADATTKAVQMYEVASPSSFSKLWYTQELDDDRFKIKLKGATTAACLTLVANEYIGEVAVLAACSEDRTQVWSSSDDDGEVRLYNGAFPNGECLTAINSGHFSGSLTMTECGTGDVATELWTATEVSN